MISGVDSSQMAMLQQSTQSSSTNSLSSSQLETISSVLEDYDANNLSQSDAQSIVAAFEDAGIEPSAELASAMEEAGFDAREIGDLAGGKSGGGMPPPPPAEETDSISSLLDTLLNTEEDEESTSTSFDDIMDYTSRILNLNDESKTEVMDLLDKYSSEDADYTAEETNNLLKTALSQILSDTNNYKSVSFYG
ncbi:hypothetical protein GA417_13010 [Poseidonibacter ostreae]|uniref:hypothetical protein n=1 Tax=Poseidonibacter ostreae TaxID=2654171 RepID=UPI0012640E60|nr:hypothetical protein [Poseidonibacter ostreae]KAB7883107.1 hypothetical protein GA417_13010 [Poseidonibacter ostreae]